MPTKDQTENRRMLSRSTILILGGVLLGLTIALSFDEQFAVVRFYAFLSAAVALLAFIGLDALSGRRERFAELCKQKRIEQRVNRHLGEETH